MGKKALGMLFLTAIIAAAAFFVFHDTPLPSQPEDSSNRSSPSGSPSFDETGNTTPDVTDVDNARSNQSAADDNDPGSEELQERYGEISDNPDYPQLQTRLDAMRNRQPNRSFNAEQVVETMAQSEAWVRVDTPPEELPLTPAEKFDGREFIRFNPLRIETLMPGDTLEIPIWQLGTRFEMRVDYAETHENGSVTWHGHLENFNAPHRVTITVGDGLSLGGIETPRGHYVLQAHGESGWIASSETLFKRNENETDMIIPPAGELEGNS